MGENPFHRRNIPKPIIGTVKLPDLPRYRQGNKVAEKAVHGQQLTDDDVMMRLPSMQREEERTRKRKLVVERHNSRVPKARLLSDDRAAGGDSVETLAMKVRQGVEALTQKVLSLQATAASPKGATSPVPGSPTMMDITHAATTMTGLKLPEEDPAKAMTLEQYKSFKNEFDKMQMEGKLLGAVSMNAPIIFKNTLVTPKQIQKSFDVNLDPEFVELLKIILPQISPAHIDFLKERHNAMEAERRAQTEDFREKYDLSTVRDIERCFDAMLKKFSKGDRPSVHTRELGLTEDEYVKYAKHSNLALSEDEVRSSFKQVAVDSTSGAKVITVDEFAVLIKKGVQGRGKMAYLSNSDVVFDVVVENVPSPRQILTFQN